MREYVLIVGACCSFGNVLAKNILNEDNIILVDQKESELIKMAQNLEYLYPQKSIISQVMDVRIVEQISDVILKLEREKITIHKMVFCVGINMLAGTLEVTEKIWDDILNINLKGFFFVAKAVIAHMIRNQLRGSIVAIASQHAVVANYNRAPYCAAKAGLVHLVKELALEFANEQIRVNVVSPSYIKHKKNEVVLDTARAEKEYLNQIPLGRYASIEDVTNTITFLLSDKSSFLTGVNILVDGGYTLK